MTEEDLKSHIYSAVERSGEILRDAMGDSDSKSVVVVPVVVAVSYTHLTLPTIYSV